MLQPKPALDKLAPGIHGGIDYRELKRLGISPDAVLDFSVSCNPFGPPPGIREAISNASIDCYPDSESGDLRQALATKLGIDKDNIIAGSGSTELIRLIALAYLNPGDLVLIPQPAYGEYEIACHLVNAQVLLQPTSPEEIFKLNIDQTIELVKNHKPKAVFLCNPNNPTGQYLTREEVNNIMSILHNCLVILDEAYIAFTEGAWSSLDLVHDSNSVILRSMTKDYALAGLRLGYAIASKSIISALNKVKPPWNVSTIAQKAGVIALNSDAYMETCNDRISEAKSYLAQELELLGLSPVPSSTNFFLVEVGNATEFRQSLLKHGILVRDCSSFGLPDYVRVAPRTLPECQKLVAAIKDVIGVHSHAG